MKDLVEGARGHELASIEGNRVQEQLNKLKQEVHSLEQQLQSGVN